MCPTLLFHLLVVSLVMPCLNYGNAALAGRPVSQLRWLQLVLNIATRLIRRPSWYEHITLVLQDLHWLWSPEHIDFKLAMLICWCLQGLAPWYLSDYIQCVTDSNRRHLQLSFSLQLVIWHTRLSSTIGDHAFPVPGSCLCSSLPPVITLALMLTVFQNRLMTYLLLDHFPHNCCLHLVLYTPCL